MAENVINSDLNLPESNRPRILRVPDVQGPSRCCRTQVPVLVAVLVVIILVVAIPLYLTLTAGRQQDSTTLTSTSQNVSTTLSPTSQQDSTKLPPSREEALGKRCCSTTRVAVLVTGIILLLLIVVCQILPYKRCSSRRQLAVLVAVLAAVLVVTVLALTLSWTLPHGPTAGSQQDWTTTIPEEALGCPPKWDKHGRKCYFFSPEVKSMDWEASREECAALGSELVIIASREELDFLTERSRYNYYLLGLKYSQEEQKWKWINNVEHDPAMFNITGPHRDYGCTVIGFGAVYTAPCGGSSTTQNMCEKAATVSARLQKES